MFVLQSLSLIATLQFTAPNPSENLELWAHDLDAGSSPAALVCQLNAGRSLTSCGKCSAIPMEALCDTTSRNQSCLKFYTKFGPVQALSHSPETARKSVSWAGTTPLVLRIETPNAAIAWQPERRHSFGHSPENQGVWSMAQVEAHGVGLEPQTYSEDRKPNRRQAVSAMTASRKSTPHILHMDKILEALSEIESGNDDNAVGPSGELSRYQIMPRAWLEHASATDWPTRKGDASRVANNIIHSRAVSFRKKHNRTTTTVELYGLWHRPAETMRLKMSKRTMERATRFANLVNAE